MASGCDFTDAINNPTKRVKLTQKPIATFVIYLSLQLIVLGSISLMVGRQFWMFSINPVF